MEGWPQESNTESYLACALQATIHGSVRDAFAWRRRSGRIGREAWIGLLLSTNLGNERGCDMATWRSALQCDEHLLNADKGVHGRQGSQWTGVVYASSSTQRQREGEREQCERIGMMKDKAGLGLTEE